MTATCAKCSPSIGRVRIYKDRLGQPLACGRKSARRLVGGAPLEHALTNIDETTRIATCSKCGPIKAYLKDDKWICIQRKFDAEAAPKHRISNVDEQALAGDCAACGRVGVRFSERGNNGAGYWFCAKKANAVVLAWKQKNGVATYTVNRKWTQGQRARLHHEQDGKCAICEVQILVKDVCVDHDVVCAGGATA